MDMMQHTPQIPIFHTATNNDNRQRREAMEFESSMDPAPIGSQIS